MSDIPDDIMERARGVWAHELWANAGSWPPPDQLVPAIARALTAERKKALEEAAEVADEIMTTADGKFDLTILRAKQGDGNLELAAACAAGMSHASQEIAAAIRKLGEEPSHYPVMKPYLPPDSFTEEELKAAIQKVTRRGDG